MVKATSVRKRAHIVALLFLGLSNSAIAREAQASRGAVRHWVSEWESGGDMEEAPRSGRPRLLTNTAKKQARRLLKSPGFGGLGRAASVLHTRAYTKTVLNCSTLSRMLREPAMKVPTRLVPDRRPPPFALTDYDMARRLKFARANKNRDWSNVMFTDRKRFYFRYPGSKVPRVQWHEQGDRRVVFKPTSPQCVNVYMGITKHGSTGAILVAGSSKHKSPYHTKAGKPARNITSEEYRAVLTTHLLPKGQCLMQAAKHRSWWFQQDNDPTHRCAEGQIVLYNQASGHACHFLPGWPPHSPELNLIENLWAAVQALMDGRGCTTFAQFKRQLLYALSHVPPEWLEAAFNGVSQRLKDTIRLKGGKTKH